MNIMAPNISAINVAAEQQLLGALLLDADRLEKMGALASVELFGDPVHQRIFEAIRRKHKAGELVSPVTMKGMADADPGVQELGGVQYLARIAGASIMSGEVVHYAKLLDEARAKRAIQDAISTASTALLDDNTKAGEVAARLEAALVAESARFDTGPVSMLKAATDALESARAAYEGEEAPGVATGIPAVDRILGKLTPGQLILLGGRPSMGKSAAALCMALNVARSGGGVCIATMEMTAEAMAQRAMSEATSGLGNAVPYSTMNQGVSERQFRTLVDATKMVSGLPIQFLPTNFRDTGALFAGAKRVEALFGGAGLKLFVVDYLQLLQADGRSRIEQITQISIALKSLAMQLQVPVLALSQLSRAVENRDEKRPVLSDLRESGQLEQDADAVLFCYRDEYYLERDKPDGDNLDAYEAWEASMNRAKNKMEIIVSKQRQGPIGTAHVRFNPATNLIWE